MLPAGIWSRRYVVSSRILCRAKSSCMQVLLLEALHILAREMDQFKSIMLCVREVRTDFKTAHFFELTTVYTVKMLELSV